MELWRTVPEGAREMVPGGRCPRCASTNVHRSRTRGAFEVLLRSVTPFRAFKCASCRWRSWRVPRPSDGPADAVALPPVTPERRSNHARGVYDRAGRRVLNPLEARRRRHVVQFVVATVLALLATGVYIANQESFAATTEQTP